MAPSSLWTLLSLFAAFIFLHTPTHAVVHHLEAEHVPIPHRDLLKSGVLNGRRAGSRNVPPHVLAGYLPPNLEFAQVMSKEILRQQGETLFDDEGDDGRSVFRRFHHPPTPPSTMPGDDANEAASEEERGKKDKESQGKKPLPNWASCGDYSSYCDPSGEDTSGAEVVQMSDYQHAFLSVNTSFGTPPQQARLAVNLYVPDMYVAKVGAVYECGWCDQSSRFDSLETDVNAYDASASSTYKDIDAGCFFVNNGVIRGELASDLVKMGGKNDTLAPRMTFGAAKQVDWLVNSFPVDGMIGFGMGKTDNNVSNVVQQLLPSLDAPVVSFYINRSRSYAKRSKAEITLGGRNSARCASDKWNYPINGTTPGLATNSVSFTNATGTYNASSTNIYYIVVVLPYFSPIYVDNRVFWLFSNATNAVRNGTRGGQPYYSVDCGQLATGPDFLFQYTDNNASLTLNAADYIVKQKDGSCYLNVSPVYGDNACELNSSRCVETMYVVVGQDFLNNHCMAFDVDKTSIGFTNAKSLA